MRSNALTRGFRLVGAATIRAIIRLGFSARFFVAVLYHSPSSFRRLQLTLREIYFSGVLSLVIILVSGLFVGMVLALQGVEVLNRYGAEDRSASWSRCRWCGSSDRSLRVCCSRAGPAARSLRRSA